MQFLGSPSKFNIIKTWRKFDKFKMYNILSIIIYILFLSKQSNCLVFDAIDQNPSSSYSNGGGGGGGNIDGLGQLPNGDRIGSLEKQVAAIFSKVAYGSTTTKRSIPDNIFVPSLTTVATPLLTTFR